MFTTVAPFQVVVRRSRFEVDLNRPRDHAVYANPDLAWGLDVWGGPPPPGIVSGSLEIYDSFYEALESNFALLADEGPFVVLDVHSYNHRRDGSDVPPSPAAENPEVNLGTGAHDGRWSRLVERFMEDLARQRVAGHALDVRENVRFKGGHFSRWAHERFPEQACALAIELRKSFMDEWTGHIDRHHLAELRDALRTTVPGLIEEARR